MAKLFFKKVIKQFQFAANQIECNANTYVNLLIFEEWGQSNKECVHMSRNTWFPTVWHFDKCRLKQACAASF